MVSEFKSSLIFDNHMNIATSGGELMTDNEIKKILIKNYNDKIKN